MANKIVEVIAKGIETERQYANNGDKGQYRLKIHHDGHTAILSSPTGEKNAWLLTGWEDNIGNKKAGVSARGEVYDSTTATTDTPTLTRRTGETSTTDTIPQNEPKRKNKISSDDLVADTDGKMFAVSGQGNAPTSGVAAKSNINGFGDRQGKGKYEGDTVSSGAYFDRARELFGTIRAGRMPKGADGYFDTKQNVARVNQPLADGFGVAGHFVPQAAFRVFFGIFVQSFFVKIILSKFFSHENIPLSFPIRFILFLSTITRQTKIYLRP